MKIDSAGNILWNKSFDAGIAAHIVFKTIRTHDGGYMICGQTFFYDPDIIIRTFLVKTTSAGDTLWTKFIEKWQTNIFSIIQTNDEGYLLTGDLGDSLTGNRDALLLKMDSVGNILWSKSAGGADQESWNDIIGLPGGDFLIFGIISPPYSSTLTRIDSTGAIIWNKKYSLTGYDLYSGAFSKVGDDFAIAGSIDLNGTVRDMLVIKTDSMGNITWTKSYGGNDYDEAVALYPTNENGIVIAGYSLSYSDPSGDAIIIELDSIGNIVWSKTYGGSGDADIFYSISENRESGFIAVGQSNSLGQMGFTDAYIINTDSIGNSGCNENNVAVNSNSYSLQTTNLVFNSLPQNISSTNTNTTILVEGIDLTLCSTSSGDIHFINNKVSISPNPFHTSTKLIIENHEMEIKDCDLKIYNSMGALMRTEKISNVNSYTLHRESLSDGLYFFQLQKNSGELIANGKFIVE
jgi:hypothetical protein